MGWKFLGLTIIVGFAGVNTGNNLLYLVFGLMLSFITTSGILSEFMLRKVRVHRTFPRHIFAQQAVLTSVTLTNRKRFISSLSLRVEDFTQPEYAEYSRYVLKIPAGESATVTYPVTFPRRGLHRPGKIRVSTRYPFGFFLKSATFIEVDDDVLVYPRIEKLSPADILNASSSVGTFESSQKGRGLEVHGIREYVYGDSSSRIHWKSTAKLAKLMTKEFEAEQKKKIALVLDISHPRTKIPTSFYQDIEHAISLTASYSMYFIKDNFQVQLITPAQQSKTDHGQRHLFGILRILALLESGNGNGRQNFTHSLRKLQQAHIMKILISANDVNDYPPSNFSKIVQISNHETHKTHELTS